jgi:hypothetical protein
MLIYSTFSCYIIALSIRYLYIAKLLSAPANNYLRPSYFSPNSSLPAIYNNKSSRVLTLFPYYNIPPPSNPTLLLDAFQPISSFSSTNSNTLDRYLLLLIHVHVFLPGMDSLARGSLDEGFSPKLI